MRKCNASTHALLNYALHTHLFLIQEPWYDRIGTARNNKACNGVDVLGGVASPAWEIHYPTTKLGQKPKVMDYFCKTANRNSDESLPCSIISQPDLCSHPCIQVLDVIHVREEWHIINFYHNIRDQSSLTTLLELNLDPLTPTLVIGDFNTHS